MAINKVVYGNNTLIDLTGDTVTADKVLSGTSAHAADGTQIAGTIPDVGRQIEMITPSDTSKTITNGYHNGTGYVFVNIDSAKTITPTKSSQSVTPANNKFLGDVTVAAIPAAYQDVTGVTAAAGDVLTGKDIVVSNGTLTHGSMTNNGAISATLDATTNKQSYTVPSGYHNGSGTVSITLEEKSATPTTSSQNITPTSGKVLSKVTVNAIPAKYGDTTNADAGNGDVLSGKKYVTNVSGTGTLRTGTMTNNGAVTASFDGINTTSYTIPAGYHNGSGTVSLTGAIASEVADCYTECQAKGATMPATQDILHLANCIASISGGSPSGYPSFTYTGTYNFYDEGNDNWHLELLSSGTLTFTSMGASNYGIDSFVVGGGAGGGRCTSKYYGGCGGNGGCVYTGSQYFPTLNTGYSATIGAGGARSANGSASSIFGYSAAGGLTQTGTSTASRYHAAAPTGGYTSATNGGDGGYSSNNATNGSNGVYPFGVPGMTGCNYRYGASGGGSAGYNSSSRMTTAGTGGLDGGGNGASSINGSGTNGTANRGAGGGGGTATSGYGGTGGSGIIILRNHRVA